MAGVARSQGGDGSGDPPQQPRHRLLESCKSGLPPAKKQRAASENLHKIWWDSGKKPLPIDFDWKNETLLPIGYNAGTFRRLVGDAVRFYCLPNYISWTDVPKELRVGVRSTIETYFNVRGSRSSQEYEDVMDGLDGLAADSYRAYRKKASGTQQAQAIANGTPLNGCGGVNGALGERCKFCNGVGWISKGQSTSVNSSVASSQAPLRVTRSPEAPMPEGQEARTLDSLEARMDKLVKIIKHIALNMGLTMKNIMRIAPSLAASAKDRDDNNDANGGGS